LDLAGPGRDQRGHDAVSRPVDEAGVLFADLEPEAGREGAHRLGEAEPLREVGRRFGRSQQLLDRLAGEENGRLPRGQVRVVAAGQRQEGRGEEARCRTAPPTVLYHADCTCGYERILSSGVMIATAFSSAGAMMMRSAGSGWNSPGNLVLRTAIAGSSGASWIPGSASATSTHCSTARSSWMRRFATSIATSHTLIAETSACSARSIARRALVLSRFGSLAGQTPVAGAGPGPARSSARRARVLSRFGSLARQIHVAVSSTITKRPPSPRARQPGA